MATFRASAGLTTLGVVLVALAGAAIAQQKPESILPPGFGDPAPAPRPAPSPRPAAPGPAPAPAPAPASPVAGETAAPAIIVTPTAPAVAVDPATGLPLSSGAVTFTGSRYALPDSSRRNLTVVGIPPIADRVMNPDAFGSADGRYIEQLMRRMRAPVASRWVSIALRRMLVQPLRTPKNVNGADFAAERAWLLLRMGEAPLARAIVQSIDPQDYTPKLYQVAMQAGLATGDVGTMCPLAEAAMRDVGGRSWTLARAMCAALSSSPGQAAPLMNQAEKVASGIDLQLVQKIVGRATNRSDVNIEWGDVTDISTWRYGLAMAAGETIPDNLIAQSGVQMRYWQVLSPRLDPVRRAVWADRAAGQGILSNAALVDLYGLVDSGEDQSNPAAAEASDLRNAYAASSRDGRLSALRGLWGTNTNGLEAYGRLVLTARAAQRVPVAGNTKESDQIVAAMFSAGLDRSASKWRNSVARGSLGWALITLGDPDSNTRYGSGDIGAFSTDTAKQKMFAAGMAGLGRIDASVAQSYGVDVAGDNSWTKAIDRAAAEGRPGEVLVLCGMGLQTNDWRGVSPAAVFHITSALRAVGLGGLARMVAAEAVTRG